MVLKYFLYYEIPDGGGMSDKEEFDDINGADQFIIDAGIKSFDLIRGEAIVKRSHLKQESRIDEVKSFIESEGEDNT